MNRHILFVHIPKTAGTSFRIAAYEYFGKEKTFFDYTPSSRETSEVILEHTYKNSDLYSLYKAISKIDKTFLSGHFNMGKYAPLYDALNIISFVREPVHQVLSHYNHFKNHYGYSMGLNEFIKEPRFRNIQSKTLNYLDISLFGFVGLTEEYNTSIDIINNIYDMELKHKYVNIKKEGSIDLGDIDKLLYDDIIKLNIEDVNFYKSVKKQFKVRQELYSKKLPFTYGKVQKNENNIIYGIACQNKTENAIAIDIYRDTIYLKTIYANKYRPGMKLKNLPRRGYVGFEYECDSKIILNGRLRAFVKETGQEIV